MSLYENECLSEIDDHAKMELFTEQVKDGN